MPKNIVILCDGTSNEISQNRTNVLRLFGALERSPEQVVFYDPGVGTFGAENAWSYYYRKAIEIWGLATGWGLDQNVKEAYKFLIEYYDDGKRPNGKNEDPDQIFIFGFSRGAYNKPDRHSSPSGRISSLSCSGGRGATRSGTRSSEPLARAKR